MKWPKIVEGHHSLIRDIKYYATVWLEEFLDKVALPECKISPSMYFYT